MLDPLLISLKLSLITTLILLLIALPLAYLLAFKNFKGRTMLEVMVALPLVLPPTVLGYYVLLMIAPNSTLGRAWYAMFDVSLAFSLSGMVLASVLYSLPFAVQPIQQAFRAIPQAWLDMACTQGLNYQQRLWVVILPASKAGFLVAATLSFAHTMGEFGVVLMVGGSIPSETKVASIALFELVEMQQSSDASLLAFILLFISFMMLSLVYSLNRQSLGLCK